MPKNSRHTGRLRAAFAKLWRKALRPFQTLDTEARKASDVHKKRFSFWQLVKADLDRYRRVDGRSYFVMFIICPGAFATVSYRIGQAIWNQNGPSWLILPLKALHVLLDRTVQVLTGISIAPTAQIGPGLYIGHFSGIFVGANVEMGSNCDINQGVTIGVTVRGGRQGSPRLGDRVYLAPGAKVFGWVNIGDDALIGANAVVTATLQPRSVAIGVPAKVLSCQGSFEYIQYFGMETDAARLASFKMRSFTPAGAYSKP